MSAGFSLVHMERYLSILGLLDHSKASSCIWDSDMEYGPVFAPCGGGREYIIGICSSYSVNQLVN